MKVADLQQFFIDMARLLNTTDAKKSSADLAKIAETLQPFRDQDVADFGKFLARAEEYARTGIVPIAVPAAGTRAKAAPKPKADHSALRAEVVHFHGAASSPSVTLEAIEALRTKLADLTKPDLLGIAEAINIVGMKNKAKTDVLNAIVSRIRSIKQSSIRTSIIDRPGTRF